MIIGALEEYCTEDPDGHMTKYRGSRFMESIPADRQPGATNSETLVLAEPVTIFRGINRRPVVLVKGTKVWRWITPLEGRR